jgi:DNA-directed RNA polymerase specialized sigma24 family protein
MSAPLLTKEAAQRPAAAVWVEQPGDYAASLLARGGGTMNTHPLPTASLQPYQQLAVRFALHRFFAHYRCPCPDHHEWHTDCLHEALYAVLRADTNEPPAVPSVLGLETEDSILLTEDGEIHELGARLSEAERERVLWLARQVENALKRYWRRERRFYGCTEALVVLDEEGEWVEREIENREALDALEAVLEQLYMEQLLERLWERLDQVERVIVAGLKEGKSQIEIAQVLRISPPAVHKRLQKIRAKAQAILAEMGENRG